MFGKSRGDSFRQVRSIRCVGAAPMLPKLFVALLLGLAVAACAHNVSQDLATGGDGKIKGAKELKLDNGEGRSSGIVTYPGGDRVDWKVVELPEGQRGNLELKLTWAPPRPGLQLGFEVYDAYNYKVASAKGKSGSNSRTRRGKVENAKGKYFIRVFAVNRGDAGKYKLAVTFAEGNEAVAFDLTKVSIPEPPRLPAIPAAVEACSDDNFDPKKQNCKGFCPSFGAPPGWPPCAGKCPTPPSVDVPSCRDTMPCPEPPDRRVKACKKSDFPPCDEAKIDPKNPNCDGFKRKPIKGNIIKATVDGNSVEIVFNPCSDRGIDIGWSGKVLRGTSGDAALAGGDFVVSSAGKRECRAKVKLNQDAVLSNHRVELYPP
ncbi:MAG TPA: hypothetical protein PLF40_19595 [Kofleriaceae bacterium]|nr:hypothetical protein [Kofleriaceae bacterium]